MSVIIPKPLGGKNPGWVLMGGDALHIGGRSHSVVFGTKSFGEGEKKWRREREDSPMINKNIQEMRKCFDLIR